LCTALSSCERAPLTMSGMETTPLSGASDKSCTARRNVYTSFLAAAFAGFLYGYSIGAVSGSVASLDVALGSTLSSFAISSLTSAEVIGATIATVSVFYVGEQLGRRRELLLGAGLYMGSSVLTQCSSGAWGSAGYTIVFAARLVYGFGIGFSMHAAPLYIAEISPPDVRGTLVAAKEAFIVGGIMFGFGAIAVFEKAGVPDDQQWRWAWFVPIIFAFVVLAIAYGAPPSPRWLVLRGRPTEAAEAMRTLWPTESEGFIASEITGMQATLAQEKPPTGDDDGSICGARERFLWTQLCAAKKPLQVGVGMVVLQQITGQPTVLYYAQSIFTSAGFSASAAKNSDLIVSVAKLIATVISVFLVDKTGRRPLLLVGISIMLVALVLLTMGFAMSDDGVLTSGWAMTVTVALMLYVSGYQVGFGPITWLLMSEVFPLQCRTRALGVAAVTNFASNLIMTIINQPLVDVFGQAVLFGFFTIMCVVSLVFVVYRVPETKGKTLEEIEEMMASEPTQPSKPDTVTVRP